MVFVYNAKLIYSSIMAVGLIYCSTQHSAINHIKPPLIFRPFNPKHDPGLWVYWCANGLPYPVEICQARFQWYGCQHCQQCFLRSHVVSLSWRAIGNDFPRLLFENVWVTATLETILDGSCDCLNCLKQWVLLNSLSLWHSITIDEVSGQSLGSRGRTTWDAVGRDISMSSMSSSVKTPAVKPCIVYIIVLLCSVGSKQCQVLSGL